MRRFIALVMALIFTLSAIPAQAYSLDAADVDGDGEVTILDATAIQRYLAGMDADQKPINSYESLELNVRYLLEHEEVSLDEEYVIYDTGELTPEILENRTSRDVLIIERVIWQIVDGTTFDVKILNTNEAKNYTFYRYTYLPVTEGTILVSYLIYNPLTDRVDDIANRYDFILDTRYEKH